MMNQCHLFYDVSLLLFFSPIIIKNDCFCFLATVPPTHLDVPSQSTQTFAHPPSSFPPQEFQTPRNVQLETANRLAPVPPILIASPQDPSIHVNLPVQMMAPRPQIIQMQQHPHGQPVQVVQRIGGKFLSSKINQSSIDIIFDLKQQDEYFLMVRLFIQRLMVMSLEVIHLHHLYNYNIILLN